MRKWPFCLNTKRWPSNGRIIFVADFSQKSSIAMFNSINNLFSDHVSSFFIWPISRKTQICRANRDNFPTQLAIREHRQNLFKWILRMIVWLKSKFTYLSSKKDHDCLFVFKHKTIWSWNEQGKQLEDIEFRHKQRRHFRNVFALASFSCRDVTMAGELGLAELTSSSLPPGHFIYGSQRGKELGSIK